MDASSSKIQMAIIRFEIPQISSRQRLDTYVTNHIKYATRNRVQRAIAEKRVLVNGKPAKNSYGLLPGDHIEITLHRPAPENMVAQKMDLDILYEDDDLLALNKPAGIPVHPTYNHWDGTIANGLLYHYRQQVGDPEAYFKPGLIHRLDKNTSGVLVVGKSALGKRMLGKQFRQRQTVKVYHALVWGIPEHKKGILETNLGLSKKSRMVNIVYPLNGPDGKTAKTAYELVEEFGHFSLLKVRLYTGRTHQIRVHLQHLGHPIIGDFIYGGYGEDFDLSEEQRSKLLEKMPRQALHAGQLGVYHPFTNDPLTFIADLPEDMKKTIEWMRTQHEHPI